MALVVADRVQETTTTTGTGTYTLAGAKDGFQSFAAVGNGNTTYYAVSDGTDYEVGIGTYTASGTTLARTTIIESSNSDAAVNWGAGTKDIFVTLPASKAVFEDSSNNVAVGNNITVGGTVDGRDLSVDGAKLDGIEAGATADQTAAEILTAIKTVDGGGSGLDADTLDGLQFSSFLRSDAADSASAQITFTGKAHVNTNTNTQPLVVSRGGSNAQERLNIGVADTQVIFNYVEDTTNEGTGNFGTYLFQLGGNNGETTLSPLYIQKNYTQIRTLSGYVNVGPQNTSYSHFYTDRPAYYFDKRIHVDTGEIRSHDEDLNLNRAGSATARIRVTNGETFSDQDLTVSGALSATTKSFVIDHPSKPGHKLRHGSLEGPENGVYVRGKCDGQTSFKLPDYWADLVDQESITVQLTSIGGKQDLWVEDIQGQTVTIGSSNPAPKYFYIAHAERVDVEKFEVEYEA